MKKTALLLILIFGQVQAQDVIIKNDKVKISAKVIEITDTHIKYRKWENLEGPLYNIKKLETSMIVYENGTEEYYTYKKPTTATAKKTVPKTNPAPAKKEIAEVATAGSATVPVSRKQTDNLPDIDYVRLSEEQASLGTAEGYQKAIEILTPYTWRLDGERLNYLGMYHWKINDFTAAIRLFRMAAAKGNDLGNFNLAHCYANGNGVPKNIAAAIQFYSQINSNFETIANVYHQIGHLYEADNINNEKTQDFNLAYTYYDKAQALGNAECMDHMGDFHRDGKHNGASPDLARYWYVKACQQGFKDACGKI